VHSVLKACLDAAGRGKVIATNPIEHAETVPTAGEFDYEPLDSEQLGVLVKGFRTSPAVFPIVCVLAFTGCRHNEALALRVTDLDVAKKTLRIERSRRPRRMACGSKAPRGTRTSARSRSTMS
jgi:integrase